MKRGQAAVLVPAARAGLLLVALTCAVSSATAAAADEQAGEQPSQQPDKQSGQPASEQAGEQAAEPGKKQDKVEGAIGLMVSNAPEYSGASSRVTKLAPGYFLRYGRYTISNSGAFRTRRSDDVMRGASADLMLRGRLRVNLALRVDRGRSSSDSPALAGLESVRSTIRARLAATEQLDEGWRLGLASSTDLLGRGGGWTLDASVSRDHRISADTTWNWSVGITAASDRYLQTYYGINEAQSSSTGYPVYTPAAGLVNAGVGIGMLSNLNERWVGYLSASAGRLLGPAADSPLTFKPGSWTINGGLAWRF